MHHKIQMLEPKIRLANDFRVNGRCFKLSLIINIFLENWVEI